MSNIWSELRGVFVEFVFDIVSMIISIDKNILMLFEGRNLEISFLEDNNDFPLVFSVFLY